MYRVTYGVSGPEGKGITLGLAVANLIINNKYNNTPWNLNTGDLFKFYKGTPIVSYEWTEMEL